MIFSLIRLRYQLLWAQSRTSGGKTALLLAAYIFGGLIFLFFSLGGIGTAVIGVQSGRGEEIARWILSGLFFGGIFMSLTLGIGPRLAFSDKVLRRYPLSSISRLAARHLIGLLDPNWLLLLAIVLGIAIGFATLGVGSFFIGLPTVLVFIIVTYLTSVVLLVLIDRVLQYKAGTVILGGFMVLLFAIPGIIVPYFAHHAKNPVWGHALNQTLRFLPPGIAATLLIGPSFTIGLFGILILIGWSAALAYALLALERRPV
ncbi:MAG: hypothetical protein ACRD4L_13265, partial [Pyrinomonadaceae bacterium]